MPLCTSIRMNHVFFSVALNTAAPKGPHAECSTFFRESRIAISIFFSSESYPDPVMVSSLIQTGSVSSE
jgi:hypothetical protein